MNASRGGIFDPKAPASPKEAMKPSEGNPTPPTPAAPRVPRQEAQPAPKKDFVSVDEEFMRQKANAEQQRHVALQKTEEEKKVEQVNSQLSGSKDQIDFDEMSKISEEDIQLAETLLFNGYVEQEIIMPNIPKIKHTICSVNAEEMNLIDEIIYNEAKKFTKPDGTIDLSQSAIQTLRSSLYLALSYKGTNGADFIKDNRVIQLEIIKKAMKALSDRYAEGDIESVEAFKESIIDAVKKRAVRVRQFGTPLIDFLSNKKYEFDTKLFQVMNTEKIIPKS